MRTSLGPRGTALEVDASLAGGGAKAEAPPDMSVLPGAELAGHGLARTDAGTVLSWACARASVPLWVEGLEGIVLEGASAVVRRELELPALVSEPASETESAQVQPFAGAGVSGRHLLGFTPDGEAILCSLACGSKGVDCPAALTSATLVGTSAAPPMGSANRLLADALAHPRASGGLALGFLALSALWILRRRPRPLRRLAEPRRIRAAGRRRLRPRSRLRW